MAENQAAAIDDSTQILRQIVPRTPKIVETHLPASSPDTVDKKQIKRPKLRPIKERDVVSAQLVRERCRQLYLSNFFREHTPVRSLGFTSSIGGEGKSFLAGVTAGVLASDGSNPVTLLELNWQHPCLHEYYGVPRVPGVAEWLRGECEPMDIRHRVDRNLTFISAGDGGHDIVKLLQQIRQQGLLHLFASSNELMIVELPSILTTGYGQLAASLVEEIILIVHARVTPDFMVEEACVQLGDLPVHGVILNEVQSHIPRWIRQIL
jgi:Mrp family chromosome partitioning ATPase